MDFIDEKIEEYAFDHTSYEGDLLKQLEEETYEKLDIPQMTTGRIEARLLKILARLAGAKRILEIGTFAGYSALSMAEALPEEGELVTCEIDPEAIFVAKKYFELSPHGRKITLMEGPALDSLKKISGLFDMAFIDADKENYKKYYDLCFKLISNNGLILIDNVLWKGDVIDKNKNDRMTNIIRDFNTYIKNDERIEKTILPIGDGVTICRKK